MEEIQRNITEVKKICTDDKLRLDKRISEEEVSKTLLETINNVAPGSGGFGTNFYEGF